MKNETLWKYTEIYTDYTVNNMWNTLSVAWKEKFSLTTSFHIWTHLSCIRNKILFSKTRLYKVPSTLVLVALVRCIMEWNMSDNYVYFFFHHNFTRWNKNIYTHICISIRELWGTLWKWKLISCGVPEELPIDKLKMRICRLLIIKLIGYYILPFQLLLDQ